MSGISPESTFGAQRGAFCPGDIVRVMEDEEIVKSLQRGHGVQGDLLCAVRRPADCLILVRGLTGVQFGL